MNKHIYIPLLGTILLVGCSSNGPMFHSFGDYEEQRTENALYRVEEPYEVKGVWYVPAEQAEYSEQGLASWYMPAGDSALTANGEVYDVNIPSARHKTLPLPSIVKITNLSNNKSIIARVNDRGPMVNNRLIDVSQSAARELEMPISGTTLVQVDLMPAESAALKQKLVEAGRVYQQIVPMEQAKSDVQSFVIEKPKDDIIYDGTEAVVETQPVKAVVSNVAGPSIQLGSFADVQNAQKLQQKLASLYPVHIDTLQRNGRTLSVVKVGPYTDRQQAVQVLQKLKQQGYKDAYISK